MGNRDLANINEKLDKILDTVTELKVTTARLETHQKDINGTIVELKDEANGRILNCGAHFDSLEKSIANNKGSIVFAKGTVYALSVGIAILTVISLTKVFGLW